jgi:uncharacterized protein (DUF58 family)
MHKSPYRGYSVEFAQHREYVPGDDIRFLDWKVYGKSDRLYVKEFEEETNLKAHVFLDQSESMQYGQERRKFDYAATMAASLAFLIQQQSDSVALELFDEGLLTQIPPSNSRAQVNKILKALSEAEPTGKTQIGKVLNELAEKSVRKGLVIVISDLFDEPDEILASLKHLRQRGQDVLLFHVLDRDEVEFPFQRMTMFEGMEAMPELLCDPKSLRDAYLAELHAFEKQIRKGCQAQKIDYQRVVTDEALDVVLTKYLARRAALSKAARR